MKRILSVILALILVLSLCACERTTPQFDPSESKLIVHFIDVGQGDSTLLESNGEFVLIDAGESEYGDKVTQYIKDRGSKTLRYVIATHPHSDHIGGLKKVLNQIAVDHFITVETDQSTNTWLNVLRAVDKHDIDYIDAMVGDSYSFGSSTFTILSPSSSRYDGYNNYSIATRVVCDDISFMLTGDAEKQSENEMLQTGLTLKSDVYKCGHHGSSTSSTASFLRAVMPQYAVISCGYNNDYGHPHEETLKKLSLIGATVYRTDELGTIIAYTDGKTVRFTNESQDYATVTESTDATAYTSPDTTQLSYVGNKNSRVFHLPECSGVKSMSEKNKVLFETRDEAVKAGYAPCATCKP